MGLKSTVQRVLRRILGISQNETEEAQHLKTGVSDAKTSQETVEEIHSIWDFLRIRENTQAFHLKEVIGFEEWVDMGEVRRRILELFGIQYKNERSLYPHLKALTDLGLFETTDVGGRRKWRKKDLLLRLPQKKKTEDKIGKKAEIKEKQEKAKS